jgi:hypothetical protein
MDIGDIHVAVVHFNVFVISNGYCILCQKVGGIASFISLNLIDGA